MIITEYITDQKELDKLTFPCLLINIDETKVTKIQDKSLKGIVTSASITPENRHIGVAYFSNGKVKWLGTISPLKVSFIKVVTDSLSTYVILEDSTMVDGAYIDAFEERRFGRY